MPRRRNTPSFRRRPGGTGTFSGVISKLRLPGAYPHLRRQQRLPDARQERHRLRCHRRHAQPAGRGIGRAGARSRQVRSTMPCWCSTSRARNTRSTSSPARSMPRPPACSSTTAGMSARRRWSRLRDGFGDGADKLASWVQAYGAQTDLDGDGNAADSDYDSAGIFAGLDGELGDAWQAGALIGYSRATFDVDAPQFLRVGRQFSPGRLWRRPVGRPGPARRRGLRLARHRDRAGGGASRLFRQRRRRL